MYLHAKFILAQVDNMDEAFINKLKELILQNISNDKFGVSELAEAIGMSRSNLLRRIRKEQQCSASQFIRNVRLQEAMSILKSDSKTVSEVAYMVGFSSTSYFIKCFREQYGYPPGEANKHHSDDTNDTKVSKKVNKPIWVYAVAIIAIVALSILYFNTNRKEVHVENSIAILPFKNNSSDSTNVYVINGLMESILYKLQSLKDLKVVSRTSVEKFRHSQLTIPEIADELNVSYILEGSGQKIGDQILLSVQLIKASTDDHLWAEQFNRQTEDVFHIQQEVAQKIAGAIQIAISPDEQDRINKVPTNNMLAYDYFLKGKEELNKESKTGLTKGIALLRKAINEDEHFALAHGVLAIAYYYQDLFAAQKQYNDSLIYFADKALLYNPQLSQALTAKALYYMRTDEIGQAIDYLEKALQYQPNSAMVINTLSEIYTNYQPNTRKYLEYALKGVSVDINSYDSITASYIYLHLSNALVQNGFVQEAENSINRSLSYNPKNLFSEYVKAYIMYAKNQDLMQTKNMLIKALEKDTTRFDIMQEIGNICYFQRNWDEAYHYFNKYLVIKNQLQLDAYAHKNLEIAFVCQKVGDRALAEKLLAQFKVFIEQEQSVYRHLFWSSYYAYLGNEDKAIEHILLFANEEHVQIWVPLFTPKEPLNDGIKNNPAFIQAMKTISDRFWKNHKILKKKLQKDGLLKELSV